MRAGTYHEQKRHGTTEFPAAWYHVDSEHPRYQMERHVHDAWELVYVVSGSLNVTLDGEEYSACAGDCLLIRGGMSHGAVPDNCVYECLVFDLRGLFRGMEMVKKYLLPFYQQDVLAYSYFPHNRYRDVCRVAEELMGAFRGERDCHELETVGGISRLFAVLFKQQLYIRPEQTACGGTGGTEQIRRVLEYIEGHYSEPVSLGVLAQIAGMNPKYLCRRFRAVTGRSPMEYTNFYRVERAAYLLVRSDLPITTVGMECGFLESSYFTKVFRKYKGISPRQYRASGQG